MNNILNKINMREFRIMIAGLGVVVTCLSIAYLVVPNARSYVNASKNVASLQQSTLDSEKISAQMETQQKRIGELNFQLHGDMANLPVRQVEAFIIGRLQRVSWRNDIELVSVEPEMGERVEIFQEIVFNVELVGEYYDLYRWLWEARNELGFVVVKEYGLSRRNDHDEEPLLLASLSLASYRAVE